jgi:hypothetical protein
MLEEAHPQRFLKDIININYKLQKGCKMEA